MSDRYPHVMEGSIQWVTEKSWLVEFTLGGKYWLPKKCVKDEMPGDPDINGNRVFEINNWWWQKKDDFEVKD